MNFKRKLQTLLNRIEDSENITESLLDSDELDPRVRGYLWHVQMSLVSVRAAVRKASYVDEDAAVKELSDVIVDSVSREKEK